MHVQGHGGGTRDPIAVEGNKSESLENPKPTSRSEIQRATPLSTGKKISSLLGGVLIGAGAVVIVGGLISNPIGWAILGAGLFVLAATLLMAKGNKKEVLKWAGVGTLLGAIGASGALLLGGGAALSAAGSAAASWSSTPLGVTTLIFTPLVLIVHRLLSPRDRTAPTEPKKEPETAPRPPPPPTEGTFTYERDRDRIG